MSMKLSKNEAKKLLRKIRKLFNSVDIAYLSRKVDGDIVIKKGTYKVVFSRNYYNNYPTWYYRGNNNEAYRIMNISLENVKITAERWFDTRSVPVLKKLEKELYDSFTSQSKLVRKIDGVEYKFFITEKNESEAEKMFKTLKEGNVEGILTFEDGMYKIWKRQ